MKNIPNFKDEPVIWWAKNKSKFLPQKTYFGIEVNSVFNHNLGKDKDIDKQIPVEDKYWISNNPSYFLVRKFEVETELSEKIIYCENDKPIVESSIYIIAYEHKSIQLSEIPGALEHTLTNTPLSIPSSQNTPTTTITNISTTPELEFISNSPPQ